MSQRTFANRVMYDGLFTFAMRIANVACAAGLGILTARMLGPAGKGLYALPVVEAGLVISAFGGLSNATSYFLLNRRLSASYLRSVSLVALGLVAVGVLALVPIAFFGGHGWSALPAMLALPASAAVNVATGFAIGIRRVRYPSLLNVATTITTLALMGFGFLIAGRTPQVAISAWILGSSAIALFAVAFIARNARALRGPDVVGLREYGRFCVKVSFVNLVSLFNYRADLYMVALWTTPANLGLYTAAIAAAESLLVPTQVAALVTTPHIGGLDVGTAGRLTARCVRNNLLIAVLVCGALYALAGPVVHFLYGTAFMPMLPALRVLLFGVLALSLGSPISTYFTLKLGHPEVPLRLATLSAAICVVVCVLSIPRFGITGAALGSTSGYAVAQIGAILYFSKRASLGLRFILIPTLGDFRLYASFLAGVYRDGQRLLRPSAASR